ncbi:Clp protease ClpP [Vallitaleaceae bacterium 9-2]
MAKISNKIQMVYNFVQVRNDLTEILIYDVIANKKSYNWWKDEDGDEVTPMQFREELNAVTTQNVCVRINSGGGDVFAAEAIRTAIQEARANGMQITCKIDSLCASAAVGIAAACESRAIASSSYFMIHDPLKLLIGYFNETELMQHISMLQTIKKGIINAYAKITSKTEEEIQDLMKKETWYTGEEAVEEGFCDEVMFGADEEENEQADEDEVMNLFSVVNQYDFKNIPDAIKNQKQAKKKQASDVPINKSKEMEGEADVEIKNIEELEKHYPNFVNQIRQNAINQGAEQERNRLKAIDEIANNMDEKLVNEAKYGETVMDAGTLALESIKNQAQKGANYLKNAQNDVENSGVEEVKGATSDNTDVQDNAEVVDFMIAGAEGRR